MSPDLLRERHYTVEELSKMWGISYEALRTRLLKTPGVLKFQQPRGRSKRPYITIRVPESVALTLYQ
jgi:hypothetical protein